MKTKNIVLALLLCFSVSSFAQKKLVILHTNDTHSRVDELSASDKYARMGGVINRLAVIDSIRQVEKNVLLIDAGDFVQGSPYYNLFHGRVEAQAMNMMRYDVGTIGNHEFDEGLDSMKMIIEHLDYPLVNCNYDFTSTVMNEMVEPYIIFEKENIRIGIIGVGIDPDGLIQKTKYKGMLFMPISQTVNHYAEILKKDKKCDLIICLTHIGIESDKTLAKESRNVNLIIGGHSHTFMPKPAILKNVDGEDVTIHQVGYKGAYLGKIEVVF